MNERTNEQTNKNKIKMTFEKKYFWRFLFVLVGIPRYTFLLFYYP